MGGREIWGAGEEMADRCFMSFLRSCVLSCS